MTLPEGHLERIQRPKIEPSELRGVWGGGQFSQNNVPAYYGSTPLGGFIAPPNYVKIINSLHKLFHEKVKPSDSCVRWSFLLKYFTAECR